MKLIDRIMRSPVAVSFGRRGGGGLDIAPQADLVRIGAGGGPLVPFLPANPVNAGVMTAADKVKLDGIPAGGALPPPAPPGEYETVTQFAGANIEPGVNQARVSGYNLPGDGGGALYVRVPIQPSHGGRVQSTDGAWWELSDQRVRPEMYGAIGDGTIDDNTAMMAMADHARDRGFLDAILSGTKIYTYTVPEFLSNIPRVVIEGNGAGFRNLAGNTVDITFVQNYEGLIFNDCFRSHGPAWFGGEAMNYGQLIDSVAAGSASVTVQAAEGAPAAAVGDRVLVYGFDAQTTASFPPNPRFFEYATVTGVAGAVVTLDAPLAYGYASDWSEDLGANLFGKPRLLSLYRTDFRETDFLHLKDIRILANPSWTTALATSERNGRLTLAGCRRALIENVEVAGGCYPSQAESTHFLGGSVAETTETDKIIGNIRFENWRGRKHTLGTGARRMQFVNCRITDGFNAAPQDELSIVGGEFRGKAEGSTSALITSIFGTRRISLRGGATFHVDDPERISAADLFNRSITITVVDSQTIDMTLADYTASQISWVMRPGAMFYDTGGAPALRVTRLPHLVGGRIAIEGTFLQALTTGDVLYVPGFEELDIRGGLFGGPYGHQIRALPLIAQVVPTPARILSERHGEGFWIITSDDIDPGIQTARFFAPGHRVSATKVVIDVLKPYTGAGAWSQLYFQNWPAPSPSPWANVNLKIAGRRVLGISSVEGAQTNDTLNPVGAAPASLFNYQGAPGGLVAAPEEAAVWILRIEGNPV